VEEEVTTKEEVLDRYAVVVFDTNELLNFPGNLGEHEKVIVPFAVMNELDELKTAPGDTGYKARRAIKAIDEFPNVLISPQNNLDSHLKNLGWEPTSDHLIISCAFSKKVPLITGDLLMANKAETVGVEVILSATVENTFNKHTGVKELFLRSDDANDQETLARFYSIYKNKDKGAHENIFEMLQNEYLIIWQDNDIIETAVWNNGRFERNSFKEVGNKFTGIVKPRNKKQELLFNLLQNDKITVKACFGKFGTGKDFCMISHAIDMIESAKFQKLIWVRNNIEVKDTEKIGYLPDGPNEKLLPFAMPLADHVGGIEGLKYLIDTKKTIEIQHLGFMRGRDIKNSIIYVSECENNTKEHIQLLISRVGEGSQLWINGDLKQVDDKKFLKNNGVNAVKKLKGNPLYGQVTLDKTERSDTAGLADLLD
jgi:PhoH-like ATPase